MTKNGTVNALAKAASHPLRRRLLELLAEQPSSSPNEMAKKLREPLTNTSYHVRMLHDLGCIELVDTEPRRGAIEHYYRLTSLGVRALAVSAFAGRGHVKLRRDAVAALDGLSSAPPEEREQSVKVLRTALERLVP